MGGDGSRAPGRGCGRLGGRCRGCRAHTRSPITRAGASSAPRAPKESPGPRVKSACRARQCGQPSPGPLGWGGRGRDLGRTRHHLTRGRSGWAARLGRRRFGQLRGPRSPASAPPLHIGAGRPAALPLRSLPCFSAPFGLVPLSFPSHNSRPRCVWPLTIFSSLLVSEPTPCLCWAS